MSIPGKKIASFSLTFIVLMSLNIISAERARAEQSIWPTGKSEYIEMGCYQCHGYEGQGGGGTRLAPDPMAYEAFANITRRPYGVMPAYSPDILSDETLGRIYQYMTTIPQPPDPDSIPQLTLD